MGGRPSLAASLEELPLSLPRLDYLPNGRADNVHFSGGEPVTSGEITRRASWSDVAFDVGQVVVYSVKAAWGGDRATINAWLRDVGQYLTGSEVAGVNFLVSRPEKYGPPFIGLCVSLLPLNNFRALFRGVQLPAVGPVFPAPFPFAVALLALVRKSKWARRITKKNICGCWQKLFAAVAVAESILGRDKPFSHKGLIA